MQRKPKEIIVRMPNWIGDLVMATPLLTDLRTAFPDAHITAMCHQKLAPLLQCDRDIDELFSFNQPKGWKGRLTGGDPVQLLREKRCDLGILLTNSFSSAWWFYRGRVKRRIGFVGDGRRVLLTDPVVHPTQMESQHLVHSYKALLEPLGIGVSATSPRIHLLDHEIDEAYRLLLSEGAPSDSRFIGVNPGAAYGSAKCWLPDRFRAVIERLLEDPRNVVICLGDPTTAPLVKEICTGLPSRVINLAGATSLRQLVAVISRCDLLLTNDSGPMHVASAVGTPLVALFGSTNDVKTGPFAGGTVIHKRVFCSPCYQRVCPTDFRCMTEIEVDEVYNELRLIMDRLGL
jgi:lipopolysaccharide heptosyltransferase II